MIEQLQLLLDAARWRARQADNDNDMTTAKWDLALAAERLEGRLQTALEAAQEYQRAKEQTE